MAKYRKKPVVVEAIQWTGKNYDDIKQFCGQELIIDLLNHCVCIRTLEGNMSASDGDYIIKGVHGEFYPCKPDIFAQTYEAVEDGDGDV